ncbi:hypothetical protein LOTGIDRAFT_233180 [Lottia gigantea]|uniref:DUF1761 family protein n=1 Tax=Lottia gigantea TaxID=225164 RepID=V4ABI0_LOTGI|nr:hypothetical protein LOTGIDRAFT_233180 [Lottia gigantea]ESO92430.1 hypothetical protein LOTGIDRAFT_233180 [Lottia gigantea]
MVLGALVGAVLSCVVGAIWYHPVFLGNLWMKGAHPGKSAKQIGQGSAHAMYISILSSISLSLLLHFIIVNTLNVQSLAEAASIGVGLACLLVLADVSHCAFGKRCFVAFLIDHAYDAVVLALTAVGIFYFNKHGIDIPPVAELKDTVLKKTGL